MEWINNGKCTGSHKGKPTPTSIMWVYANGADAIGSLFVYSNMISAVAINKHECFLPDEFELAKKWVEGIIRNA